MNKSNQEAVISLVGFQMKEWVGERLNWDIRQTEIGEFNLLIGDNAQGKTRFYNVFRFLKNIHVGPITGFNPLLKTEFALLFTDGTDKIEYQLKIKISKDGVNPEFDETIKKGNEVLFSRREAILKDEIAKETIHKFFVPGNVPIISSVREKRFQTIGLLKSFFERMLFLEANRFAAGQVSVTKDALIMMNNGSNVASVMESWSKKFPDAYQEVIDELQETFNVIKKDSLQLKDEPVQGLGISAPLLSFKEQDDDLDIKQIDWSDGMLRTLALFVLPATRFPQDHGGFLRPSLVCVDEIENGLDFNTLSRVLAFYQEYSSLVQVLISSHSPLVCELVDPKDWRVCKRRGPMVKISSPQTTEKNLDQIRKKLLRDNWQFYKHHVSKSKLYSVQ